MRIQKLASLVCGVLGLSALAAPAFAAWTPDPAGDFIPTYVGPQLPEVDILGIDVTLNNGVFNLSVEMAGPVDASGLSYIVWGIDRGAGVPRLQFIGCRARSRSMATF